VCIYIFIFTRALSIEGIAVTWWINCYIHFVDSSQFTCHPVCHAQGGQLLAMLAIEDASPRSKKHAPRFFFCLPSASGTPPNGPSRRANALLHVT
jgi:hypothetical protein